MVRGLQEKQYQLAAQKRHEANIKYNYYKDTVKFFSRENENNKQFNSWCFNEKSSYLDKSLKAQKLRQRQSQLKSIFQNEQDQYEKELLELKLHKNQAQDNSIEALKHKLKEKKAEQSLYLPKDCRRFQSYFYNTRSPTSHSTFCKETSNSDIILNNSCPRNNDSLKGSLISERNISPKNYIEIPVNVKTHQTMYQSQLLGTGVKQALYENLKQKPVCKLSTRSCFSSSSSSSSCKSLEETNIRNSDESSTSFYIRQSPQLQKSSTRPSRCDSPLKFPETSIHDAELNNNENNGSREFISIPQEMSNKNETTESYVNNKKLNNGNSESLLSKENSSSRIKVKHNFSENCNKRESLSWMRENPKYHKLPIQMVRYLANKDLKEQILNLSRREFQACRKQWWTQALRLREMKNKLELIKEQNIYNTLFSHMDSKSNKTERRKIDERLTVISQRENICKSASVYDEDAKILWNQWMHEDERIGNLESLERREILLAELEKEWKNLDQEDRRRLADIYQNIVFKSKIQDEYNLVENIKSALGASAACLMRDLSAV